MAAVAQISDSALVPPQNLEAEESVLGAMMLSPGAIGAVSEIVDAGDFYRESHAKIYRAALALYAKGEPVDAITLTDQLEERGELEDVGGRVRLHELAAMEAADAPPAAAESEGPAEIEELLDETPTPETEAEAEEAPAEPEWRADAEAALKDE